MGAKRPARGISFTGSNDNITFRRNTQLFLAYDMERLLIEDNSISNIENGMGMNIKRYNNLAFIRGNDSNTDFTDRLRLRNEPGAPVTYDNNLVGGNSDNIIDANGNLTPEYQQYQGTRGHMP
jgi:hypothetical protein